MKFQFMTKSPINIQGTRQLLQPEIKKQILMPQLDGMNKIQGILAQMLGL